MANFKLVAILKTDDVKLMDQVMQEYLKHHPDDKRKYEEFGTLPTRAVLINRLIKFYMGETE